MIKLNEKFFSEQNYDGYIYSLFSNSLINRSLVPVRDATGHTEYIDNSMGYRTNEFSGQEEMLVSGCSFTYGEGIDKELIWSHHLSEQLDKKHINIAHRGFSIDEIVRNVISYCEEYKNVKTVFCLFPPLYRFLMPQTEMLVSYYSLRDSKSKDDYKFSTFGTAQINDLLNKKTYFKTPIATDEIISWQIAYYFNIKFIRMLELYCKLSNIDLYWMTWDIENEKLLEELQKNSETSFLYKISNTETDLDLMSNEQQRFSQKIKFNEYKNNFNNKEYQDVLHADEKLRCHEELYNENFSQFHMAKDFVNGPNSVHPGAHFQIHIFELFYKAFMERNANTGL